MIAHLRVRERALAAFGWTGRRPSLNFSCAVERRASLAGANPARQLSLQPVAARAVHGGNDMD